MVEILNSIIWDNGGDDFESSDPSAITAIYTLSQELYFRAFLKDGRKCAYVLSQYPLDRLTDMAEELQRETGSGPATFGADHISARNVLLCYNENYGKLAETLAGFAAVAQEDKRWRSIHSETYLSKSFGGRYTALLPDKDERLARNALTHRDVVRRKDGKFVLEDLKGKKTVWTAKRLDDLLNLMAARMALVAQGFSLPGAMMYEVVRVALRNGAVAE
jgi:hypothetical protein